MKDLAWQPYIKTLILSTEGGMLGSATKLVPRKMLIDTTDMKATTA